MSSAAKRSRSEALRDANDFKALFDGCADRWIFAGSVRRLRQEVSDVEHVVIPSLLDDPSLGLFGGKYNALWRRLDQLVKDGTLAKHLYGNGFRWGPKYRGISFRGYLHEIFCADVFNWGSILAIRTGSADYSRQLVTGLRRNGRRNADGYVWRCEPCPQTIDRFSGLCVPGCKCEGTGLICVEKIPTPTEEDFFRLAGFAYVAPEQRN